MVMKSFMDIGSFRVQMEIRARKGDRISGGSGMSKKVSQPQRYQLGISLSFQAYGSYMPLEE